MAFELFGFKIERKSQETEGSSVPAFTLPESDDGSMMVSGAGALGYSLDMDGQYKNEVELILKYRDMSQMSDCEIAIDNVCLLYTSPSPRDLSTSRMPSSA